MRVLAVIAVASVAVAAHAQFVNGNFSSGTLAGWTLTDTPNGASWVNTVESIDIDVGGPLGTNNAGKFAVGNRVAPNLGQQGILLTQMLSLVGGVQYTFQFDWRVINVGASANAEGGQFNLIVNGTSIAAGAAGSTAVGADKHGHLTGVFTPTTSGSYSVGASMTRQFTVPGAPTAPTLFQYVDNFTMSPVPEPATMAALGLGVAAMLRRRRK